LSMMRHTGTIIWIQTWILLF